MNQNEFLRMRSDLGIKIDENNNIKIDWSPGDVSKKTGYYNYEYFVLESIQSEPIFSEFNLILETINSNMSVFTYFKILEQTQKFSFKDNYITKSINLIDLFNVLKKMSLI